MTSTKEFNLSEKESVPDMWFKSDIKEFIRKSIEIIETKLSTRRKIEKIKELSGPKLK